MRYRTLGPIEYKRLLLRCYSRDRTRGMLRSAFRTHPWHMRLLAWIITI